MLGIRLSRLPVSAKIFCTLYLLGIGCGAIAAFAQAATAIGLTPADVRSSFGREMPMTSLGPAGGHGQHQSAEKEISVTDISSAAKVWVRTPLLIQTSHTHLFGQTLIAALLGLIFLFSSLGERLKSVLLALPFVGTLVDIGGPSFARFCLASPSSALPFGGGSLPPPVTILTPRPR